MAIINGSLKIGLLNYVHRELMNLPTNSFMFNVYKQAESANLRGYIGEI
jgi:hypothetical protein